MSAYDLVKIAREKQNLTSDNALAMLLEIDNQKISNWKNKGQKPDGVTMLKLADKANLTPSQALKIVENGFGNVSLLAMTGLGSSLAMALLSKSLVCILCKIKRKLCILKFHEIEQFNSNLTIEA